jgi:hypothetical protein
MSSAIFLLFVSAFLLSLHFWAMAAFTDEAVAPAKQLVAYTIRKEIQDYH